MSDPKDLDYYLKPEYQTPEDPNTSGVIAPIQGAQVAATPSPSSGFTPEERNTIHKKWYESLMGTGQDGVLGEPAKLVSTKPDWYLGGPPPKSSTGLGLAGTGLNALAQGRQKWADTAAQNPLRSMAMKQGDQAAATRASILGGLVNLLGNKSQNDFQNEQNAALKESEMNKVLPGSRPGEQAAGYAAAANWDQRERQLSDAEAKAQAQAELQKRLNDANSAESKQLNDVALRTGIIQPDDYGKYSYNTLMKMKPVLMQAEHENWRGAEGDRALMNRQSEEAEKANRAQIAHAQQLKMSEEQRQAESSIPGRQWVGAAPNPTTVNEARELSQSRDVLKQSAQNLADIQAKLSQRGILEGAGGNYRLVEGIALSPEDKQLVEDAKKWQAVGSNAYRQAAKFGTLTGKDKELADEVVQQVGTPAGWSVGPQSWKALIDVMDRSTETRLRGLGSVPEGEKVQGNPILTTPAEERIHKFKVPAKVPYSRNPQVNLNEGAAPEAGTPTAGAQTGQGNFIGVFSLTTTDKDGKQIQSTPRPLTQEQYDNLSDDVKKRLTRMQ